MKPGRCMLPALVLAAVLAASGAWASPAGQAFSPRDLFAEIEAGRPVTRPLPVTSLEQAYAYRDQLVELQRSRLGDEAGYKAALTSPAVRGKFRADRPVLGTVLKGMMLRDRSTLEEGFALRPVIEADLMAVVESEAINEARTPEEALACMRGVHPMIEMADLVFQPGVNILPLWITAINAGACRAVVGSPVLPDAAPDLFDRLGSVRASVMNKRGEVLAAGAADSLTGHPMNAALWIRDEVRARGGRLKQGDVLWLGSLTEPVPVEAGESYQVLYTGLDEYPVSLQVNIRRVINRQ